ncbi:MAG TPA: hypothetical protein VFC63_11265, partial [Blastocatellia bacterium]|nr:hypothetical protein [Blastocatellia bacterium]
TFLTLILSAPLKVSFISLHLNFLRSLAKYMWTYVVVTTFFRFFTASLTHQTGDSNSFAATPMLCGVAASS